jgi:hypothetical protein
MFFFYNLGLAKIIAISDSQKKVCSFVGKKKGLIRRTILIWIDLKFKEGKILNLLNYSKNWDRWDIPSFWDPWDIPSVASHRPKKVVFSNSIFLGSMGYSISGITSTQKSGIFQGFLCDFPNEFLRIPFFCD